MHPDVQDTGISYAAFLSEVAHELKGPMTSIQGFCDAILDKAISDGERDKYLHIISDEVKRLSRLTNELLDFSRLETGTRKFVFSSFDICELSRLILISLEKRIEEKKLCVEFVTDLDRMTVTADRDGIYQALYNICENAVKYSYSGGKLVLTISYMNDTDSKANKLSVSVYNEGNGMSEYELSHVFDRLYRGDSGHLADRGGLGLGMNIAKAIIDAHGETVFAESEQGIDCKFTFTLKVE